MAIRTLKIWEILKQPLPHLPLPERIAVKILLIVFRNLIQIDIENEKKSLPILQKNDPAIFAINHNNSLEALLIPCYLIFKRNGKKISFIIDWVFSLIPIVRWLFEASKPVYVYNKKGKYKFLEKIRQKRLKRYNVIPECLSRLNDGMSIGIFPEGKRNGNPHQLLRGKKGIGQLVLEKSVPVIPVGLEYNKEKIKNRIRFFSKVLIRIGNPLDFKKENQLAHSNPKSVFHYDISSKKSHDYFAACISDCTMRKISQLCNKKYSFPKPKQPGPDLQKINKPKMNGINKQPPNNPLNLKNETKIKNDRQEIILG